MRDTATGLAIGFAGGLAFWALGIPAPWLAGSMMAAIVAVFSKVKIGMPDWLRAVAFIFLGIQTGTAVSWDTVDRAIHWPLSIAFLCLTVVAVTWACTAYYIRRSGWDAATALFASLPGALSLTLLLASGTKADMRRVTIAQCIRLFFLVAALPTVIT
jgi:membrane AbrB-like protein